MNPAFYDHSTCLSEVEKAYTPAQKQAPYDKKNQLTIVDFEHNTKPGNDYNFTYDPVGNRQTFQHAFGTEQYSYANNCNKLEKKVLNNTGYIDYKYDNNGNLTNEKQYVKNGQAVRELQTKSYTWNAENRLLQIAIVKSPNNPNEKLQTNLISFTYDHLGQRVSKSVNGKTTYYLYQGIQVIAECDASGKIIDKFIYGHNKIGRVTDNKITYHYEDVIASVNVVADAQGNFSQMNIQDAFGNCLYSEGSDKNDYTFAGKEKDESGLFYFVARYYDPTLGRFISRDALPGELDKLLSLNRYIYSLNNPLRYIDPTGNKAEDLEKESRKTEESEKKLEKDKQEIDPKKMKEKVDETKEEIKKEKKKEIDKKTDTSKKVRDKENKEAQKTGKKGQKDKSSEVKDKEKDIKLLAKLIYFEAKQALGAKKKKEWGFLDKADREAVGWSVRNRVEADKKQFGGDTYEGVITKKNQYEPVGKSEWKTFDPSKLSGNDKREYNEILKAAKNVMESKSKDDPTKGATHFHAGFQTDVPWAKKMTKITPKTAAQMTKVDTYKRVYDKSIKGYRYKDSDPNKKGIQHERYKGQAILFYK